MSLLDESQDLRFLPEQDLPAVGYNGRFFVDLGGTTAEIRSTDEQWLAAARARFGQFVIHGRPADITIRHTPDEATMRQRYGCLSVVHADGEEAMIAARSGTEVLDGVLRTLLPPRISPDLMVHGALLSDGVRGFLCCGVSGSGKSTLAGLFPQAALCDEMVRVTTGPECEAKSLPFWNARPATVSLAGVFEISHGVENKKTALGATQAVRSLRRHVYWPVEQPDRMAASFVSLSEICRKVPVFSLNFRPDRSVWATLTEGF